MRLYKLRAVSLHIYHYPQVVANIVWQMGLEDQIVIQGHREHEFICYQPSFFMSEQNLNSRLAALLRRPLTVDSARVSAWIDRYVTATGIQLSSHFSAGGRDGSKSTNINP